jgi:hypothetical protein
VTQTVGGPSASITMIPSPIATGGGGERFEQRLDAYALALLLARSTAPVLIDAVVTEVHLQTRHLGWCTDDVLIVGEVHPGARRRLAIQAKRSFTVSAADDDCVQTIRGMWDDFVARDRFNSQTDRLAVAVLQGTATLLGSFAALLDCARAAASADDFRRRVALDGYLSKTAKRQHEALLTILRVHMPGGLNEDQYWEFLRVITVLSFDLGTATSQTDAMIESLLAHLAFGAADPRAAARETWKRLLDEASEGRPAAKSYVGRDALPADLLARHSAIPTADDRGRLDLIDHGRTVRRAIRSTIAGSFSLDRGELASALITAMDEHRVVVVAGAAGSGKSALAKSLLERIETDRPVLAFQAVEFATAHIDETLSKSQTALNARGLLAVLAAHDRTTVLVDGVERLLEHSVRDGFGQLLELASSTPSLRLVLTCRDYSLETVRGALLAPSELAPVVVEVAELSEEALDDVAAQVPALRPPLADPRMRRFLRTPYLLDMASRLTWDFSRMPANIRAFREKCWRELVRDDARPAGGMPARREAVFVDVARRRASELRPYIKPGLEDPEAIHVLREASLLERSPESDKLLAPAHDVLEDWAILSWLDDIAAEEEDTPAALANSIGGLPAMRRGLRRWLAEQFDADPQRAGDFVVSVTRRADLPPYFRDDCVVAVLLSDSAPAFLEHCRARVDEGDKALLRQVMHLLRVACKTPPAWLPVGGLTSTMLVPTGPGWAPALALAADHVPSEPDSDAFLMLGLVEEWVRQLHIAMPAPPGADAAGQIVSALLPLFRDYGFDAQRKRALETLLRIPRHAPAFGDLVRRALVGDPDDRLAREFADLAVSTFSSAFASRDYPAAVIDLLRARLMMSDADRPRYGWSPDRVDGFFGLRESRAMDFFPASAIQGPFRALFTHHPRETLAFVIELTNHAGDWYGTQRYAGFDLEPALRVDVDVPGAGRIEQWFNWRLYVLFRGLSVGPYALKSALMALETWLLDLAKIEKVDVDGVLLRILRESNNVMTTAVVASVCIAYPGRAPRASLALLSSRTLIQCDRHRMAMESSTSVELLPGLNPSHFFYEDERRNANALPHRGEDLESLAVRLQMGPVREDVWALIDRHRAELDAKTGQRPQPSERHDGRPTERVGLNETSDDGDNATEDEAILIWRLALHRMDVRGFRVADEQPTPPPFDAAAGKLVYVVPGQVEPAVQRLVDESRERMAVMNRHLRVLNQARKAWDDRRGSEAAAWQALLADARALADEGEPSEAHMRGGPGIAAAVCIRDRLGELAPDELEWCAARVEEELRRSESADDELVRGARLFGPDRAGAAVAALLVAEVPEQLGALGIDPTDLLVRALTHPVDQVVEFAFAGAGAFLQPEHADVVLRCAAAAVRTAEVSEREHEADRKRGRFGGGLTGAATARLQATVRETLAGSDDDSRTALGSVRFDTWEARGAARRICVLVELRPEWVESRAFAQHAAAWLATRWTSERRGASGERDFHAEYELSRWIARFVLRLPDDCARDVGAALIAVVTDEPREVATFVEHLIGAADGGANDSFWALWQAFADRMVEAPWLARLDRDRPYEGLLVDRIFLGVDWKEGVTHWARLDGQAHRVHALARQLPPAPACVQAYLRFLYTVGRQALPGALVDVDAVLSRGEPVRLTAGRDTAYYLESLLGQFVYAQPLRLKRDPALRSAVLRLLDALVAAGSSAAYRMRDDFVTPFGP